MPLQCFDSKYCQHIFSASLSLPLPLSISPTRVFWVTHFQFHCMQAKKTNVGTVWTHKEWQDFIACVIDATESMT